MSLRTRILLLVLLATLTPAVLLGLYLFQHRDSEIEKAKENLAALAKYAAAELDDRAQATVQLLHGLSRAPDLDTPDKAACSAFLAEVLASYPQYTGLLTIRADGRLHCDSLRTGRTLDLNDRKYFRQARATLQPAFEAAFGRLTGTAVLQVAYPARESKVEPGFVLLASLNLSKFARGFAGTSAHPGMQMLVWDRQGTLMVRHPDSGPRKLAGGSFADSALFRFAGSAQAAGITELPGVDGESRIWALSALPGVRGTGMRITLGIPREALVDEADRNLRKSLAILVGVSLSVFLGAWFIAEISIRRQAMRIMTAVRRVGAGDLDARVGAPYPAGELGDLMLVIDKMVGRVQVQQAEIERKSGDLRRSNRTHRMLSAINAAIVRVRERDELFREGCRIAVEVGGFRMAWLGLVDRVALLVKPVAWHGTGEDYIGLMPIRLDDAGSATRGLAGQAVMKRKAMIADDMTQDPRILLKQEALERGFRSLVVLPLVVNDQVEGVLALYAGEIGFFDEEEMKLLNDLAGDIAFALDHLAKNEKLDYLAFYDQLTGLANRALFLERLQQLVRAAGQAEGKFALEILDIERMSAINESLGRPAGDDLLKQIAQRLSAAAGANRVARIGADHFALILPEVKGRSEIDRMVQRIWQSCAAAPFPVNGTELRISAKAGITRFPADGADAETLLGNAEAALSKGKQTGEPTVYYTNALTRHSTETLSLDNKLRQALEKEEFVLHYQPKLDLETRAIVGVEALIRWQSPELGLVPPAKFIPLMEETGLILEVGTWALTQASLDHRKWFDLGLKAPRVAVNVSPIQLRRRDFVGAVERAIIEGIAPTGIDLEITESLIMEDVQGSIEKLKAVRGLGVRIAIDDFGTGYSSLGYLAKLPVQTLKIDRSFIITMLEDPDTMTLVQTIISLAHSLRLKVVAEGVDMEEQAKMLRLLRCDEMQGFLYSKPLPFEQMAALLKEERKN